MKKNEKIDPKNIKKNEVIEVVEEEFKGTHIFEILENEAKLKKIDEKSKFFLNLYLRKRKSSII